MPRRPKVKIILNDLGSLQSLYSEIYHDLFTQRMQIISDLARLINSAKFEDDHSLFQIYKVRSQMLNCLISLAGTKLALAKLMSTGIGKESVDNAGKVTLDNFSLLRKLLDEDGDNKN